MSDKLKTFREIDYQKQKEILSHIIQYLRKNNFINEIFTKSNINPIIELEKLEKEFGISDAYKSVNMGINDILDWTKDLSNIEVKEIDDILQSKKLETLTQLRDNNFKKIKKIIRKKEINNETDYYLLNNILNDENIFTTDENYRERINNLISAFEEKISKI